MTVAVWVISSVLVCETVQFSFIVRFECRNTGAYVIVDLGADIDACVSGWLNDGLKLSHRHEISLSLLLSFGRCIGLSIGLGINIVLGAGLSGSECMFLGLCLVDNFSGYPDTRCRHKLSRGHDLSLGNRLYVGLDLGLGLSHCDRCSLCHCLSNEQCQVFQDC